MKLGIMQPYFFPYIGYFALIKQTDEFILFDTPQFIRHGWIERNQILKPNGERLYIKAPLKKHHRDTKIKELVINDTQNWRSKILAQLVPYKKVAPNYWKVIKLLKEIFEYETTSIVEFNLHSLRKVCDYLNVTTPIKIWSEMGVSIEDATAPDEWALNICKALGANTYYNPMGGTSFFDRSKYEKAGIDLKFMESQAVEYKQFPNEFAPFLSIIDLMMFCNVESINEMMDNFKLH
ncbi:MAG: WbqC family protein [Aureispira sp.]|nr:WbqC family protein [Aureispira sp.]